MNRPHVVVVGGGFGGLSAARGLRRLPVDVTLVDRTNHHVFQPLLYQVATAGLSPAEIAAPIRHILRRQRATRVLLGEATAVDLAAKTVRLDGLELAYDYLILAAGNTHSYFGHDEWRPHAPGLKTIAEALEIRRRVLIAFEQAEREEDAEARRAWLTFVVIGGGPTGVEMAGALGEIARHTLAREFRRIDPSSARIVLIEAGPRVLSAYTEDLSERARLQLEALGVQVWTGSPVSSVSEAGVRIGADHLAARTVVWAAGLQGSALARTLGAELDRAGRVRVRPDLSGAGPPAYVRGRRPRVARGERQARARASRPPRCRWASTPPLNVARALRGEPLARFHYRDKGIPRDDRKKPGRRHDRPAAAVRARRVARLARHPHLLPDRLPQPAGGARRLVLGVRDLRRSARLIVGERRDV
jgi:NADH dehydrogenase